MKFKYFSFLGKYFNEKSPKRKKPPQKMIHFKCADFFQRAFFFVGYFSIGYFLHWIFIGRIFSKFISPQMKTFQHHLQTNPNSRLDKEIFSEHVASWN